jgi:hypothetical protein
LERPSVRYYLDESETVVFLDMHDMLKDWDAEAEVVRVDYGTSLTPETRQGRSLLVTSRWLAQLGDDERVSSFVKGGGHVLQVGERGDASVPTSWHVLKRPFNDEQFLRAVKAATRP